MFSQKTTTLINYYESMNHSTKCLVIKPKRDTRYSKDCIMSHTKREVPAINVVDIKEYFSSFDTTKYSNVFIDEGHFFNADDIYYVILDLLKKNINVFIALLNTDYTQKCFLAYEKIAKHADKLVQCYATCTKCGTNITTSSRGAIYSIVKPNTAINFDENNIAVGGEDEFSALCQQCFLTK